MPLTPDEKTIFDLCLPHLPHDATMFDVGAYKGEWTEYAKGKLPDASCYLFEASNELCHELIKQGHAAVQSIVSGITGEKIFYECLGKSDEMSSTYHRKIFDGIPIVTHSVKSITIDSLNMPFIDFLKIDVEGAEFDVLKGASLMMSGKSIRFIQVEYGGTYPDAGITFKEVIDFVNNFGYIVYELIDGKLQLVTYDAFIEDYRFANFLISRDAIHG